MVAMITDDNRLSEILEQLKLGAPLVKQKIDGKRFPRRFFLHDHETAITYRRSKKIFGKPRAYYIKDIDEVRSGFQGETFNRLLKRGLINPVDERRAFSIMYDDHRQEVHLMAPDPQTRDLWIEGLQHLLHRHGSKGQGDLIREENWILNYFRMADKNQSNSLTKRECRDLLEESFHVIIPNDVFDRMFERADRSSEGVLNSDEFIQFFHILTRRRDLYDLMKRHSRHGAKLSMETIVMDREDLLNFLLTVQHMTTINRLEQVQSVIDTFEMNPELRKKGLLSLDGFRGLLLSKDFDIIHVASTGRIYQDMTRPLCDYYINTSHNTYLFYSQISGDSNPEAYNRVLLAGGRAVELDCYDGSNGEPIVKHAYTLVKPCTFESIIRGMQPNLFKTSPYPVILNIENHCSLEQQRQMARILKNIFGDYLVTKPITTKDPSVLPSPEDLKYKVLIRSKKTTTTTQSKLVLRVDDDDDSVFDPLSKNIESELAELFVYLQNVPFRDNAYAKTNYTPFHSSSLVENHFLKLAQKDPTDIVLQTTWRLLRTYPDGLRQDSSNQDPVHAWNFGIQMAALNYQNSDDMMAFCYGKFLDNGGCGYILKPDELINARRTKFNPWNPSHVHREPTQTLTIKIISGQFLPRSDHKSTDIPDPYVSVSVHGLPCDERKQKTAMIANNGFDPIWNETFQFHVRYPQMCLIYFAVYDQDTLSNDDRIAFFCLPMTLMQVGYRHIHLRANNNDKTHSTLFVHIDIQNSKDDDDDDDIITVRL